ncbi:hypothetical protein A4S06_01115 [Erysipelotrichaceae bacterium MTC7]|nr:hypothetical protein A4S06_01115 [Erysipelotrichaceae bacterium MTC7]
MKIAWNTILVDEMETSFQFYVDVLGLQVAREVTQENLHLVFLKDEDGICVELIKSDSQITKGNNVGFILQVDDMHAKKKELEHKGVETGELISPAPGVNFFHVSDPNGVTIQIQEKAK